MKGSLSRQVMGMRRMVLMAMRMQPDEEARFRLGASREGDKMAVAKRKPKISFRAELEAGSAKRPEEEDGAQREHLAF